MKVLVANLGSTSFKYRVFDMADEKELARGAIERVGSSDVNDHATALRRSMKELIDKKVMESPTELAGIGFKAVHARGLTGVHRVDEKVLEAMEAYNAVAPAHNPPYVIAMRLLAKEFPDIPQVAAFETGFHETIDMTHRLYAVPLEWARLGVQRWGFHGASHRYIAERTTALVGKPDARIISCHLGGSSSICAIHAGESHATTMGMSPQSGLPQNNRVGDFDVFALPAIMSETGKSLEQVLDDLANRSGLLGLSGCSNDLREIEEAANDDDPVARQALDVYVASVRHYLGAYLLLLGGADAIVFTGGIGENSVRIRRDVCRDLEWLSIHLSPMKNESAKNEARIDAPSSRVQIWIMPTNEELIVARQTRDCIAACV